jgi:hypothetical protein
MDAVVGCDSRDFADCKLIIDRERHVAVYTLGLLLAVMATVADVGDLAAAQMLLPQVTAHHLFALVQADGSYIRSLIEYSLAFLTAGGPASWLGRKQP